MDKPTIPEVMPLVIAYYAKSENSVGGSLHIVLEDRNVDDASVEFCKQWAIEHKDIEGIALAEILLRMSRTQRNKICAIDKTTANKNIEPTNESLPKLEGNL